MDSRQEAPAPAQMRRETNESLVDQASNAQGQSNFLQETGENVKTMAQGAADIGKGAAMGAVSLARGAATGAANVAQGAADVVKNTFGANNNNNSNDNGPTH